MLAAPKVSLQYSINLGHQHTSAWRTHNSCPSCDDVHIPFRLIGKGKTNVLVYSRFKFIVVNARKLRHVGSKPVNLSYAEVQFQWTEDESTFALRPLSLAFIFAEFLNLDPDRRISRHWLAATSPMTYVQS
jgi:hypothetical protein